MSILQKDVIDSLSGQEGSSTLVSRNITVRGRRTSVRLEPEMWAALKDIAKREECSIHDVCSLISIGKNANTSLTAAIRVFLMLYYRAATSEEGHRRAGHGSLEFMKKRISPARQEPVPAKENGFYYASERREATRVSKAS